MEPIIEVVTYGILSSSIYEGAKYAIKKIVDTSKKLDLKRGMWSDFRGEPVSIIIPSIDYNDGTFKRIDQDTEDKYNLLKNELQNKTKKIIEINNDLNIPLDKLSSNLVLIGPPNVNSVVNFILPRTDWGYLILSESIRSKHDNVQYIPTYDNSRNLISDYVLIIKTKNPFNKNHSLLYFGGLSKKLSYPFPYFFESEAIKKIAKKHANFSLMIRLKFYNQKMVGCEMLNVQKL